MKKILKKIIKLCFKLVFITKKFEERNQCDIPETFFLNVMIKNIKIHNILDIIEN